MQRYLRGISLGLCLSAFSTPSGVLAQAPANLPAGVPSVTPPGVAAPLSTPSTMAAPAAPPVVGGSLNTQSTAESWASGNVAPRMALGTAPMGALIGSEIYVQTGPSFIIGGGTLRGQLNSMGWTVVGGGRSLFYDSTGDAAWTLDLAIHHTHNNGGGNNLISIFGQRGTIRELNRTAGQVAIGREYFPAGNTFTPGLTSWRSGWDWGMRWGAGSTGWNPVRVNDPQVGHKYDVFGATFLAANLNLDVPIGGTWSYVFGLRGELSYTFSSLVPGGTGYLYDMSILLNMGLRF